MSGDFAMHVEVEDTSQSAQLTVYATDGSKEQFTLRRANPDKAIRFALGQPGHRSSVWRVWANKGKHDVYAAIRTSAGVLKYSFHESGEWIHHLVSASHPKAKFVKVPNPDSKRLDTWRRPEPFVDGWTHMLSIFVPAKDLQIVPGDDTDPKGIRWLTQVPADGNAVLFQLLLVSPDSPALLLQGHPEVPSEHAVVDGFVLSNGEVVLVVASEVPLDEKRVQQLKDVRKKHFEQKAEDFEMTPSLGPRFALPMVDDTGHRCIWDLTFDQQT